MEVNISKVDNCMLLAMVLQFVDKDLYRLGTKEKTFPQFFTWNQLTECEKNIFKSVIIIVKFNWYFDQWYRRSL